MSKMNMVCTKKYLCSYGSYKFHCVTIDNHFLGNYIHIAVVYTVDCIIHPTSKNIMGVMIQEQSVTVLWLH